MKPHRLLPLLGGILMVGLLAGVWEQHRRLAMLRAAAAPPPVEPARPAPELPVPAAAPLTDAETRELLTLRRDVGQLRRQRPNFDQLRRDNARLRAAVTHIPVTTPDGSPASSAYQAARTARFTGLATPADTLQSFLFAARSRDTNVLFRVLTPASAANLAAAIENQGAEAALADLGSIPGFRVQALSEAPEGTAEAALQFDPRASAETADSETLQLERINGEWRLKL